MIARHRRGADADHRDPAGVPGAGRVAGDDLPSPAAAAAPAAQAAADAGRALTEPEREQVLERAALRAVRRRLAGGDLRDAAGRGHLPVLDADDVPDPRRPSRRGPGAARSAHPPAYAKPELLAERPNELWSWDISKLKGPAKWTWFYLYVILDVFSRYIVGWTVAVPGERPARQGADRAGDRAAADHAEDPDAARRPRRADARQAGGVPARRPRRHQDAQPPVHLQRQPLLGVELQDAEVPARVPRPVRRHRARPRSLPRVLRLVQPRSTATPGSG